jgi:hypothetical protein
MKLNQDQKVKIFTNIMKGIGAIAFGTLLGLLAYNIATA